MLIIWEHEGILRGPDWRVVTMGAQWGYCRT